MKKESLKSNNSFNNNMKRGQGLPPWIWIVLILGFLIFYSSGGFDKFVFKKTPIIQKFELSETRMRCIGISQANIEVFNPTRDIQNLDLSFDYDTTMFDVDDMDFERYNNKSIKLFAGKTEIISFYITSRGVNCADSQEKNFTLRLFNVKGEKLDEKIKKIIIFL